MNKTILIMRQELRTIFSSKSYIFFAFGIPILALLTLTGIRISQGRSENGNVVTASSPEELVLETEGYVDQSGLVHAVPEDLSGFLLAYETEEQAQAALLADEISSYYIVPPDYIKQGEIFYVFPDDKPYTLDDQKWIMQRTMTFNLLGGDPDLADRAWSPIWEVQMVRVTSQVQAGTVIQEDCSRPGSACYSNKFIRLIPSILVVIFYIAFMSSSSMLFSSIGTEKENRTIEVLMLSISPRQLLAGKTIGMGLAGLLQTMTWMAAIYISLNQAGTTLSLPEGFKFPFDILAWSVVFFLGGFAFYASLMAGAGAMVPKMKEAGVANFIAIIPLLFGYIFGLIAPLADLAGSAFMVFLGIFPLTSPVVMIMRLTDTAVPLWQVFLSAVLLFASAYYAQLVAAAMFQAQNLLSGQPFSVRRYLKALVMLV
jgi:ABC-2 type transport system permease protein